jgi:hypothetical protein
MTKRALLLLAAVGCSFLWAAPVAAAPASTPGYVLAASDGGVFAFGRHFYGSAASVPLRSPIVRVASAPGGRGYWLAAADGGVFAFGHARFFGSMATTPLRAPVVGIAATPSGRGYWLAASDGGVFAFGDARFHGSLAGAHILAPVVGIATTASGNGYWLATASGEAFAFGDALASGAPPAVQAPVDDYVGIARVAGTTRGVVLVTATGAIFEQDTQPANCPAVPAVAIRFSTPIVGVGTGDAGCEKWLAGSDGGVFTLSGAFFGSAGNLQLTAPIVGMSS